MCVGIIAEEQWRERDEGEQCPSDSPQMRDQAELQLRFLYLSFVLGRYSDPFRSLKGPKQWSPSRIEQRGGEGHEGLDVALFVSQIIDFVSTPYTCTYTYAAEAVILPYFSLSTPSYYIR